MCIRDRTTLKLSKFTEINFGGTTENFKKHRRILRRQYYMRQNPNDAESSTKTLQLSAIYSKEEVWYPWKCISLVRKDGKTLDLTVGDSNSMISLYHALYKIVV